MGLFCVKKKSGQQRVIMDCRGSNLHFNSAPSVSLCTSESLARIKVMLPDYVEYGTSEYHDPLEKLVVSIGTTDVYKCVHRLHIPESLSRYFSMLRVKAESSNLVGQTTEGCLSRTNDMVYPASAVLLMGFCWSPNVSTRRGWNPSLRLGSPVL